MTQEQRELTQRYNELQSMFNDMACSDPSPTDVEWLYDELVVLEGYWECHFTNTACFEGFWEALTQLYGEACEAAVYELDVEDLTESMCGMSL